MGEQTGGLGDARLVLHTIAGEARMLGILGVADFSRELADVARTRPGSAELRRGLALLGEWLELELDELIDDARDSAHLDRCRDALVDATRAEARAPIRVLLVDDSPLVRLMLTAKLEDASFEVAVASDGAEALEAIGLRRPDVVLTDLDMPGMSGLELLRRVQELEPTLPVIVLSGEDRKAERDRARALGAADFVLKTGESGELLAALDRALAD